MKTRFITVGTAWSSSRKVAQLRLVGRWLERLGYHPGAKVVVQEDAGRLTLQVVSGRGYSPCE